MLKQVDFPAPLGPISARNSPSLTSKLTFSTACTPPKAFDKLRCGARSCGLSPRRHPLAQRADDAAREHQHQQQDHGAEQAAPERGLAHDVILQNGENSGADDWAGQSLNAA